MAQKKPPMLSKSRFLAGLQCHLRLWYQCFERELIPEIPPSQQAIFDTGHEVGELATQLYPGGVLINAPYYQRKQAVQSTLKALQDPDVKAICEAAFVYDGVHIRADILHRLHDGSFNFSPIQAMRISATHFATVCHSKNTVVRCLGYKERKKVYGFYAFGGDCFCSFTYHFGGTLGGYLA